VARESLPHRSASAVWRRVHGLAADDEDARGLSRAGGVRNAALRVTEALKAPTLSAHSERPPADGVRVAKAMIRLRRLVIALIATLLSAAAAADSGSWGT